MDCSMPGFPVPHCLLPTKVKDKLSMCTYMLYTQIYFFFNNSHYSWFLQTQYLNNFRFEIWNLKNYLNTFSFSSHIFCLRTKHITKILTSHPILNLFQVLNKTKGHIKTVYTFRVNKHNTTICEAIFGVQKMNYRHNNNCRFCIA